MDRVAAHVLLILRIPRFYIRQRTTSLCCDVVTINIFLFETIIFIIRRNEIENFCVKL